MWLAPALSVSPPMRIPDKLIYDSVGCLVEAVKNQPHSQPVVSLVLAYYNPQLLYILERVTRKASCPLLFG